MHRRKDSSGQKCFQRTHEDISTVSKHTIKTSELILWPHINPSGCTWWDCLCSCVSFSWLCGLFIILMPICWKNTSSQGTYVNWACDYVIFSVIIIVYSLWMTSKVNVNVIRKCEFSDVRMACNPDLTLTRAIIMKTAATRWPQSLTSELFAWNDHTGIIYMVFFFFFLDYRCSQ